MSQNDTSHFRYYTERKGISAEQLSRETTAENSHLSVMSCWFQSPYTFLLQLSPLVLIIVLSLLSSLLVGQAPYSLRRDA